MAGSTRSVLRRSLVWGAGALTILTLALGVPVGWSFVEEEIWIRRLDSSDEAERRAAAERLARMKSSRAVTKLVRIALKGRSYAVEKNKGGR